jgi:hypothetical protein
VAPRRLLKYAAIGTAVIHISEDTPVEEFENPDCFAEFVIGTKIVSWANVNHRALLHVFCNFTFSHFQAPQKSGYPDDIPRPRAAWRTFIEH